MTFMDGSRVTPGTEKCVCDTAHQCEFPCWQRLGLTDNPCCPGCSPEPLVRAMMDETGGEG